MNSFAKQLDVIFPIILNWNDYHDGPTGVNILESVLNTKLSFDELSELNQYGDYLFAYYPKGWKYTDEELWEVANEKGWKATSFND